jgi:hypothetical protein
MLTADITHQHSRTCLMPPKGIALHHKPTPDTARPHQRKNVMTAPRHTGLSRAGEQPKLNEAGRLCAWLVSLE